MATIHDDSLFPLRTTADHALDMRNLAITYASAMHCGYCGWSNALGSTGTGNTDTVDHIILKLPYKVQDYLYCTLYCTFWVLGFGFWVLGEMTKQF
jgi:hypothetical protein